MPGAGVLLEREEHRPVEDKRRVGIDDRVENAVPVDEIRAHREPAHLDTVARAFRRGDGSHERLVIQRQVRVRHAQVTDRDRQIDRFADDAAGVVKTPDLVVHSGEVAEIFNRCVAAAAFEIVDERWSETRAENHCIAANANGAFGIAGVLHKGPGRRANPVAAPAGVEPDAFATDAGTSRPEDLQCLGIPPKLHADFVQDSIGVVFDDHGRFRVEKIGHRDLADEIRRRPGGSCGPRFDSPATS